MLKRDPVKIKPFVYKIKINDTFIYKIKNIKSASRCIPHTVG